MMPIFVTRIRACALFLALAACNEAPRPSAAPAPVDTAPTPMAVARPDPPAADRTIRADGIAQARIGMTIGELRAALPAGVLLGPPEPFLVDLDGMPVVQVTDTLYYVLIATGEPSGDDAPIELLATTNPAFRTLEGVGPGSTLGAAAALGGEPRLSYSTNDESREWAAFPDLPASIMFRLVPSSEGMPFAGYYLTDGEYNETSRYDPEARISMVVVRKP